MKILGFMLLVAGWGLVLAALMLLGSETPREVFISAGVAVEITGFVLVIKSHPKPQVSED